MNFDESGLKKLHSVKITEDKEPGNEEDAQSDMMITFEDPVGPTKNYVRMSELRSEGHFCDITLYVKGKEIKAHKLMLAAASTYFRNMLLSGMRESRTDKIELKDVDPDALEALVNFVYTSQLTITQSNVQSLMMAAAMLVFTPAFNACGDFLVSQLHPTNCLSIRQFAESLNCEFVMEKASVFFLQHFMECTKMEDQFTLLPPGVLKNLLSSDKLNISKEEVVLASLLEWMQTDPETKQKDFPQLFCCVRLPLLDPSYIVKHVESISFIMEQHQCRNHIDFAKNFHLGLINVEKLPRAEYKLLCPRLSTMGTLLAIGGRGVSSTELPFDNVEMYNFYNNSWSSGPSLTSPRRHVGVVAAHGKVYAVGGENSGRHLRTVECFDMKENAWKQVAPLAFGRRGIAVGVLNGVVYAAGGLDEERSYNTVEQYDPEDDRWNPVAPMMGMRCGAGATALGRYLYVVGGNDGESSSNSVERYDPHLNKWSEVTPMNCKRAGGGVASLDGYIYAVGGFADVVPLNTVERYDPNKNEWNYIASMSVNRGGLGLAVVGRYLFALGGHNGREYLTLSEIYDPFEDKWTCVAPMMLARAGVGVAVCNTSSDQQEESEDQQRSLDNHIKSMSPLM